MRIGPLKHRDFRLLWLGWVLSTTAGWVFQVVSMWLIFELTDSPLMLGVTGIFGSVPFLITSLYGGAFADRLNRRNLLLIAQIIITVVAFIPGVLSALDLIQVWHIYAISFLNSLVGGLTFPARDALVPALVPRDEVMSATAFTTGIHRSTALIGPTIGGLGISFLGAPGAFLIFALLDGLVLLTIVMMKTPEARVVAPKTSINRSILEGFQTIIQHRILWGVLSLQMVHTLFVTSNTLMPVFARDILQVGPTGLGLCFTPLPGLEPLGSGLSVAMGDRPEKGASFVHFRLLQAPCSSTICTFHLGSCLDDSSRLRRLFDIVGTTVRRTILQLSTEPQIRGRVFAMNMMVNRGLGPLSGLQSGALASLIGAPSAIATGAALFVIYAIFLFFRVPEVYRYPGGKDGRLFFSSQDSEKRSSLGPGES